MMEKELTYDDVVKKEYLNLRWALRQLLSENGVYSNPAVSNDWIVDQLKQLLTKNK